MKGKSLIGVILAAICVTVTYLLPGSEELSHEGITALGVLGMASILWISNTLPFGVTGLLALVMLVLLGVSDMASVFVGFSNSSVIFVITVFCLTAAVMNTKLTLRLINKLLRWAGSSAEKLVLAYMAAAALLSSVMSNVPVTVLFLGLAQPVLKAVGAKPGSSRLGKCLMIGIPFAAVNGGMATPAGSSFNVLAMGVFESIAGKPLTFLQWMAVGLPTAIVATLVCWICLVKIFKPEAINEECSASIREEAENAGKISAYEKKVLFMLVAMPVLWILGTWFPALDVTVVSIIGFVVMFMPGINILTWKQFEESVPWNIGRGLAKQEDLEMVYAFAAKLGAEVGCSRPIAQGENWMAISRYIGVSGVMLKPDIYVALGISGQVQHTVGVRDAKIIIAVNKDKNAPIFKQCDYGIVGDIYKVVPALTELL